MTGAVDGPDPVERYILRLLRLYPLAWRRRYGDELAAVVVDALARGGAARWRITADVAAGALDAHLNRSRYAGTNHPMPSRISTTAQATFLAFVAFVLAGSGFAKLTEDAPFKAAARAHAAIGLSFDVVYGGAIAAALIVLGGGLPVLAEIARQALRGGRRDLRRLLVVPPACVCAWFGFVLAASKLDPARGDRPLGFIAFVAVTVLAAGVAAAALVAASRRAVLPARISRAEWVPMSALCVAMVAVSVGALVWGLALRADAPGLYHGDNGLLATALPLSWAVTVAVMAAASALAVGATARAIRIVRSSGGALA